MENKKLPLNQYAKKMLIIIVGTIAIGVLSVILSEGDFSYEVFVIIFAFVLFMVLVSVISYKHYNLKRNKKILQIIIILSALSAIIKFALTLLEGFSSVAVIGIILSVVIFLYVLIKLIRD